MTTVRRRRVLFLAGFDPKGAAYYHRLYREQTRAQGRLTGIDYEVSSRRRNRCGNDEWTVRANGVETTFEHLRWDDLVRAHWPRDTMRVLWQSLAAYMTVLQAGRGLWRVGQVSPRTLVALAYPLVFWLLPVLAALSMAFPLWASGVPAVGWGVSAAAVLVGSAVLASRLERRLNTSWLLHIFSFAAQWSRGPEALLQSRVDSFASRVQAALDEPNEEVLVVGYSVGSMLAVSTAARWLRAGGTPPARLSLLTLGQCVPLLALLPHAAQFRQELAQVAACDEIDWIDISSPTDWGSFALVDPVALSGVTVSDGEIHNPRALLSPRFHTLFKPLSYARIRRNKRRIHLQYLMASELAGGYDYFEITAGPLRLGEQDWQRLRPST